MNVEDKVAWVHGSTSHQELAERYDIWAHDYDRDLIDEADYIDPQRAVEVLAQW